MRLYANHPTIIDFADAETTTPQLNISLLEGETGVVEYPLRAAVFASVHALSLFFVSTSHFDTIPGSFPLILGAGRTTPSGKKNLLYIIWASEGICELRGKR